MNESLEKVVITGVRSGFGDGAVTACAGRGYRVWGKMRLPLATVALLFLSTNALAGDPLEPRSTQMATGGAADIESPPAADASLQDVVLYATFDDFRQGRVTGRTRARVMPRGVMGGKRDAGEPGHFWALDLRARRGRALGKVYAFAAGGEVYVAEGGPRPNRSSLYGRLQRVGERGVLMQQVCFPVSQYGVMSCFRQLRLLDLTNGTSVDVSPRKLRKLLDSEPELRRRFDDEPRKNEETRRRYLVELLERDPGAGAP